MSRQRKGQSEELVVIMKAYDLIREMTERVAKFPRDHKFLLGDRILTNVYDVLDILIEAKYSAGKLLLLDRANLRLEQVRFQIRLAHDGKLFSTHQYEVAARLVNEVGRLIGGWRRSRDSHAEKGDLPKKWRSIQPKCWRGLGRRSDSRVLRGDSWNSDNPDNFQCGNSNSNHRTLPVYGHRQLIVNVLDTLTTCKSILNDHPVMRL